MALGHHKGREPAVEEDEDIRAMQGYLADHDWFVDTVFLDDTWITNETDPANLEDWYGIADPRTGEGYESGQAYLDEVLHAWARLIVSCACVVEAPRTSVYTRGLAPSGVPCKARAMFPAAFPFA